MSSKKLSTLRFNFGFLLEADLGTSREIELDYPVIRIAEDVTLSPLQGVFQATRTSKGIYLQGDLHSAIAVECARCLTEIVLPITIHLDDLVYSDGTAPPGEYSIGDNGILDMAPLVREISLLEIPIQPFCQPACRGLCPHCGQNLNEGPCDCQVEQLDPRLSVLRALLDDKAAQN